MNIYLYNNEGIKIGAEPEIRRAKICLGADQSQLSAAQFNPNESNKQEQSSWRWRCCFNATTLPYRQGLAGQLYTTASNTDRENHRTGCNWVRFCNLEKEGAFRMDQAIRPMCMERGEAEVYEWKKQTAAKNMIMIYSNLKRWTGFTMHVARARAWTVNGLTVLLLSTDGASLVHRSFSRFLSSCSRGGRAPRQSLHA